MSLDQWPAAFRAAGLPVQLHNGFPNTSKPQGSLNSPLASLYIHHDATPAGPTPGALNWIIDSYNSGDPSAQLWLDTSGVWHFCGAGVASHAGVVRGGLTNRNSVGVETDHTVNEMYPAPMMASLLKGCAVACKVEGRQADFITFHKIEASPRGRKQDPWLSQASNTQANWDKELADFRAKVQVLLSGGEITNISPEGDWFDMASKDELQGMLNGMVDKVAAAVWARLLTSQVDGKTQYAAESFLTSAERGTTLYLKNRYDVVIYEDAGGLWWSEAGQSVGIPDPTTLDGMVHVATRQGKQILSWPGGDVQLPGAFGHRNDVDRIPGPDPAKTYVVASGDTFGGIAAKLGVTVDALKAANPQITNPDVIDVGQVLNVPKA